MGKRILKFNNGIGIAILILLTIMSTRNYAWQTRLSSSKVDKQIGKILVPAFTYTHPLIVNSSLKTAGDAISGGFDYSHARWVADADPILIPSALPFSIEFFVKPNSIPVAGQRRTLIAHHNGGDYFFNVEVDENLEIKSQWTRADAVTVVQSNAGLYGRLNYGVWNHVAFTCSAAGVFKVYVNGTNTSNTVVADINAPYGLTVIGGNTDKPYGALAANFSELRMWNIELSSERIQLIKNKRVSSTTTGVIFLAPLTEQDGLPYDVISNLPAQANTLTWDNDDAFEQLFGCCFPVGKFHVTSDHNTSLRFPVELPANSTAILCVTHVDENNVRHRYYLNNDVGGFISRAENYAGQALGTEYTIEVWYKDGLEDAIIPEDFYIYTRNKRIVTTTDYNTIETEEEPTLDQNFYESFPLTYPLTFDQAQ